MAHDQNWEKRQFVSFSPQFRIDVNNPQTGFNGPGIYDLYGYTENGDVSLSGMTAGGIYRLYNDRTIEIIGGANSDRGGVDICITGMKGSILITAQENGEVLWQQRLDNAPTSYPITYRVDGKQYVAVATNSGSYFANGMERTTGITNSPTGASLWVFALP